jgi:hypothetical protein
MHPSTAAIDLAKKSSSWPSPMCRAWSSGASAARAGRPSIRGEDVCARSLLIHGAHVLRDCNRSTSAIRSIRPRYLTEESVHDLSGGVSRRGAGCLPPRLARATQILVDDIAPRQHQRDKHDAKGTLE